MVRKHGKVNGDRTIGGAITIKRCSNTKLW